MKLSTGRSIMIIIILLIIKLTEAWPLSIKKKTTTKSWSSYAFP